MATYLATVQIGRYQLLEHRRAPVPLYAAVPGALVSACDDAFGRQPEMLEAFIRALRATTRSPATPWWSPRTSSRSRSSRRACRRSARNFLTAELGRRAAGRARAVAPVVRQQPDAGARGATSGCTRASPATPSGSGRRSRASAPRTSGPSSTGTGCDDADQDLVLGDPGPDADVRRPGLQARRARSCTPCGSTARRRGVLRPAARLGRRATRTAPSPPTSSSSSRGARGRRPDGLFEAWLNESALPDLPAARLTRSS